MAGVSLANGLKSLFTVLGCLVTASVIYTVATDGLPFRKELLTPWMAATLIDFYINIFAIWAWVAYKESNWITAIIWAVLLFFLGSITTCGYIVLQFLNLSTQESLQDPVYFVLLRSQKKTVAEQRRKCSLLTARILSIALGCLMLGSLIYTLVTDGSPFRRDVLTPWLSATLIDFYANVVALSVWVAYKESSWLSASFWIILLICFGRLWACIRPGSTCSTKDPLPGRKQQQQKQQPNKSRQVGSGLYGEGTKQKKKKYKAFFLFLNLQSTFWSLKNYRHLSGYIHIIYCSSWFWATIVSNSRFMLISSASAHVPILLYNFSVCHLKILSALFFSAAAAGQATGMKEPFKQRTLEMVS